MSPQIIESKDKIVAAWRPRLAETLNNSTSHIALHRFIALALLLHLNSATNLE
jgi:hypothetical protein